MSMHKLVFVLPFLAFSTAADCKGSCDKGKDGKDDEIALIQLTLQVDKFANAKPDNSFGPRGTLIPSITPPTEPAYEQAKNDSSFGPRGTLIPSTLPPTELTAEQAKDDDRFGPRGTLIPSTSAPTGPAYEQAKNGSSFGPRGTLIPSTLPPIELTAGQALGLLGDYAVDRLHNMKDMPLSELELIAFESSDRTMPELNVKEYIVHEGAVNYTYNQGSFQTWINEIELELSSNRPKASRKSKIALALLEGLALPAFFGADRCYMGQVAIGIIKGITLGGLGIWAFIDYIVIFINMLKMNESINCFGFSGEFRPDDIEPAFEISVVLVIFSVFLVVLEQTKRDRSSV